MSNEAEMSARDKPDVPGLHSMSEVEKALPVPNPPSGSVLGDSQWKMLEDYIEAIPDGVELIENNSIATYRNSEDENNNHEVPVDKLHNLIAEAVKSESSDTGAVIFLNSILTKYVAQYLLHVSVKQLNCINHNLSSNKNGVTVKVEVSESLKIMLQLVIDEKCEQNQQQLSQQQKPSQQQQPSQQQHIEIKVRCSGIESQEYSVKNVTNMQALVALVVVLKCYPREWQQYFFWDAWLAVTIQLNILQNEQVSEVFPCLWMKQIFYPERLVESPDKLHCLIMGQDPVSERYDDKILRGATGIAFHNTNKNSGIPAIENMELTYGLNCTGDWPLQYCKDGILLVNMIRCIPKGSNSMDSNLLYNAWFMYSLKLAKYFANQYTSVAIMCNRKFSPNLVECIQKVNSNAKRMEHPAHTSNYSFDKGNFHQHVFKSNFPILWRNVLLDYIYALPDKVAIDDSKNIANVTTKNNCTHKIAVNDLHNIVVKVIKCEPCHLCAVIHELLQKNTPPLPNNLANITIIDTNQLRVAIQVSQPLTLLLQRVVNDQTYIPLGGGCITIQDSSNKKSIPPYTVTDSQALLALAVTLQCYPKGWGKDFFWDAWLAVTIQLGLLKMIDDSPNGDHEVFPCLWMKQIFYAERLVGSPENVRALLMGQNPKRRQKDLFTLRIATGITINDNGYTIKLKVTGSTSCADQCRNGVFQVNMIRCIHRNDRSLDNNDYYYAWFGYTLKLVKYCYDKNIPVVLCSSALEEDKTDSDDDEDDSSSDDNDDDDYSDTNPYLLERCIKDANPNMKLLITHKKQKNITVLANRVNVSRIQNNVTLTFDN